MGRAMEGSETRGRAEAVTPPRAPCPAGNVAGDEIVRHSGESRRVRPNSAQERVILAAIAIPAYSGYQLKSKQSEAFTNVGGVKTSIEAFAASNDGMPADLNADGALAPSTTKAQWTGTDCDATCAPGALASCDEFACVNYRPVGPVYHRYEVTTSADGYAILATGDLDGDGVFGYIALVSDNDADGAPDAITGIAPCAATAEAAANLGNVINCTPGVF